MLMKPRILKKSQSAETLLSGIGIKFRVKDLSWRVDCYADDKQFVVLWGPNFRYSDLHSFITIFFLVCSSPLCLRYTYQLYLCI